MYFHRIPCIGEVQLDSSFVNVLPLIQSGAFQLLRHRKQLGQVHLVYAGATHSRLEHSVGTFARTRVVAVRLLQEKVISYTDAVTACVYALLHDIGHPPFSHTIEPLMQKSHHVVGMEIVQTLAKEIKACATTVQDVLACFEKKHPAAALVSDGSLGIEKLDYLQRDSHHTGFGGLPEIDMVESSLVLHDGKLLLRKRGWHEAMALIRFSHMMFERVYECSKSAYARRLVQKMYERLLQLRRLEESDLRTLTDARLEGLWGNTPDEQLTYLYQTYSGHRMLPRTGLAICKDPWGESHARGEKTYRQVREVSGLVFKDLARAVTWRTAHVFEERLAKLLNAPVERLFVVPTREERRYRVPNIQLLDYTRVVPIADVAGEEIDKINASAARLSIIRVGTDDPSVLEQISSRPQQVLDVLSRPVT